MSKHTPGPWGCVDTSNHAHDYRLTKPNGSPLPLDVVANDHGEQRANARLIAAAPELLAALEHLAALAGTGILHRESLDKQGMIEIFEQARAASMLAIAKATTPPT